MRKLVEILRKLEREVESRCLLDNGMLEKNKQLKIRDSSIELLRIISMVMIVACHFATHGGFSFDMKSLSIPRLWWSFIEMGGNLGVDIFVLISGYFLVTNNAHSFNFKRIFKFWSQVFVYSIIIFFIFGSMNISDFGLISCIKAIFPITFDLWWFASTYFVLYLIHPFINMLLQKFDRKRYQTLIVTQLILWCIIPTFSTSNYQSNMLIWFVTLYCVAGYIRLFGLNPRFNAKTYLGFYTLFSTLRYLSCVILMIIGTKIPFVGNHSIYFYNQQSILTFLSALSLFMVFEKCNIGHVKWINIVASATFGVYLIHDSKAVRYFLWHEVFKNAQYQNSILLIPYSIIVVSVVYVVCTLIDLIRQYIVEKPLMIIVNNCSVKIIQQLKKTFDMIIDFVLGERN